jgi:hypothetical protein
MSKSPADLAPHDEQILSDELPDAVLEVAASQMYTGHPYTLAFCTGFSSCPFGAPDRGQGGEVAGAIAEAATLARTSDQRHSVR